MSRVSDALQAKTMHYAYSESLLGPGGLSRAGRVFRDSTTTSSTDTIFIFPHIRTNGITIASELGAEEYKCMRFDPEITVQPKNFTKNTTASPGATFGFGWRHSSVGIDGQRVALDQTDFPAGDTTLVLSNVWPDSAMLTRFSAQPTRGQSDPDELQSGLNMLLSVNLRRTSTADTTRDTMAVLIVRLKYTTFGGTSGYVMFNRMPNIDSLKRMNTGDPSYGIRFDEEKTLVSPTDRFVIRRHHLPASTDNINVSARATFPEDRDNSVDFNLELQQLYGPRADTIIHHLDIEVSYVTHAASTNNVDVEIDAFKIETPQARDVISGNDSARFVNEHIRFLRELDTVNTITGRRYRVASWYAKDEAMLMYWEGWRYYNRLVDSASLTEIKLDYANHMLHKTGVRKLWQGHTPLYGEQTAVPYYTRGYDDPAVGTHTNFDYLGFRCGTFHQVYHGTKTHETAGTSLYAVDYETYWGHKDVSDSTYSAELPMPDSQYTIRVCDDVKLDAVLGLSTQCAIEGCYYRYAVHPEFLFLGTEYPWYANIWPNSEWRRDSTWQGILNHLSRPATGSEVLAMAYGQLVLGAKGLLAYYGVSSHDDPQAHPNYPLATDPGGNVAVGATSFSDRHVEPTGTGYALLRNADLGTDFFDPNPLLEPTRVTGYMMHPGSPTVADPGYFADNLGVDTNRLYAGRESNRIGLLRAYTHANHIRATLEGLELQCWWAKGYKQWTRQKAGFTLTDFVKLDSLIEVAHPSRVDSMGVINAEAYDSVFFDVTIHKHKDTLLSDAFYIGIANRRTDPRVWNGTAWQFYTEAEFEDSLASTTFNEYDQKGARELRLPFNYSDPSGLAVNLHITELTPPGVTGIDTVIGAGVSLPVRLRPGYGKFLRVQPVPAAEGIVQGFLDHSNQRKMVAFPTVIGHEEITDTVDWREYLRMIVGDTMYYHQVYHRRRPLGPGFQAGAVSVYYRRSLPMRTPPGSVSGTQYVYDASTIQWEPEQLISNHVLYDPPGDPVEIEDLNLSCGYPALVVRPAMVDTVMVSKVYVVFGCEFLPGEAGQSVLVCETVLPAEDSRANQIAYYAANPSRVLDATPAPVAPILQNWGTPMVNASQSGNYYCWSHAVNGIGVGFKTPNARVFTPAQAMYLKARPGLDYATHPSVNSYSRLQIGEEDAGLVWQEGNTPEEGPFIFYTRLWHGAAPGYAINYQLNPAGATRTLTGAPLVDNVDPQIGMITDTWVNVGEEDFGASHAFPMVYRHLSDWETAPDNSRHDLRLVNHKAERVYWQARKTHFGIGPWMIARRVVDVTDYSLSPLGGADNVYSIGEQFIYSATQNLRGPDAAQGEQWGEPGSVPNHPLAHYDDSCSVLNYWSDTSDVDPVPNIWHMVFGFSFYGTPVDTMHADLIAAGKLEQIHGDGRYPHLAARFSVSAHRGYQRNRRIFDQPGGTWANFVNAPFMTSSSEYFYKQTLEQEMPVALVHSGFRGGGSSATLGPILVHDSNEWITMHGQRTIADEPKFSQAIPRMFVSDWFDCMIATDLTFTTNVRGDEAAAKLFIERESDGKTIEIRVLQTDRPQDAEKRFYTVLGGEHSRYRFVLEPATEKTLGVMDVELMIPASAEAFRKSPQTSHYGGVIDLAAMNHTSLPGKLNVYPNPTSDELSIVFDLRTMPEVPSNSAIKTHLSEKATIEIYNAQGVEMCRTVCSAADAVHVSTAEWSIGIYTARIKTSGLASTIRSFQFVVVR